MKDAQAKPELPFVSVIMPVRNEADFIARSVGSVLAQDYPADRLEVLVADGMSDDNTPFILDSIRARYGNLKIIDNPGKIVSTGLNAAMVEARGDVIIRVDGHCEIAPDYIRLCVQHLQAQDVQAVGGVIETVGESHVARAIAAATSSRFGVGGSLFRIATGRQQFTDTVAFPAYQRSVMQLAGAFDEELIRNQDDEYNYRLRKLGVKILLAPDIRSRYFARTTFGKLWKQYFQYGYWKVRVLQKHPRQMQPRQFLPGLCVIALLAALILALTFPIGKYVLALLAGGYALALAAASLHSSLKTRIELLPLMPIAFAIIHFAYGTGFLVGLVSFWNRWGNEKQPSLSAAQLRDFEI